MQRFLTFIVLVIVINYSQSHHSEFEEEVDAAVNACLESTGVDHTVADDAFFKGEFVPDENFKCFLKCLFVSMGDMTESGELLPDNMKTHAPPGITQEQAHEIVDECTTGEGSDPCDIAYNSAKCMYHAAVKMGL